MASKISLPALSSAVAGGGGVGCLESPLHLVSYNLGGLDGQGKVVLTELCSPNLKMGVIMLQEHWLSPDLMPHLQNFSPFFTTFGISGMQEKLSSGILKGRPFGGAALLVHRSLLAATTSLLITERVNVIRIGQILFINVYCPSKSFADRAVITSLLDEISCVIGMHPGCEIIMGGDFNVDLRETTPHSKIFLNFIKKVRFSVGV